MAGVIFVSRFVGNAPEGHFLYLYRAINSFKTGSVLGGFGAPPELAEPVFPFLACPKRFQTWISVFGLFSLDNKKLGQAIADRQPSHLVFYDGDLSDLWLAIRLSVKFPALIVSFNLHRGHIWSARLRNASFLTYLRRLLPQEGQNFVLTAESKVLADLGSVALSRKVSVWPMCSNLSKEELEHKPQIEARSGVLLVVNGEAPTGWISKFCDEIEAQNFPLDDLYVVGTRETTWHLISKSEKRESYIDLLCKVKVVVLAYFESFYLAGSSGRLADALCLGAHVVVPPSTALAEQSWGSDQSSSRLQSFDPEIVAQRVGLLALEGQIEQPCRTAGDLIQDIAKVTLQRDAIVRLGKPPGRSALLKLWALDARLRSFLRGLILFFLRI